MDRRITHLWAVTVVPESSFPSDLPASKCVPFLNTAFAFRLHPHSELVSAQQGPDLANKEPQSPDPTFPQAPETAQHSFCPCFPDLQVLGVKVNTSCNQIQHLSGPAGESQGNSGRGLWWVGTLYPPMNVPGWPLSIPGEPPSCSATVDHEVTHLGSFFLQVHCSAKHKWTAQKGQGERKPRVFILMFKPFK